MALKYFYGTWQSYFHKLDGALTIDNFWQVLNPTSSWMTGLSWIINRLTRQPKYPAIGRENAREIWNACIIYHALQRSLSNWSFARFHHFLNETLPCLWKDFTFKISSIWLVGRLKQRNLDIQCDCYKRTQQMVPGRPPDGTAEQLGLS